MELLLTLSIMALTFCIATTLIALLAGIGLKITRLIMA